MAVAGLKTVFSSWFLINLITALWFHERLGVPDNLYFLSRRNTKIIHSRKSDQRHTWWILSRWPEDDSNNCWIPFKKIMVCLKRNCVLVKPLFRYYCTQTKSQQQHYKMTIFEKVKKKADLCFMSLVTWLLFFFFWNLIFGWANWVLWGQKDCVNHVNFDRFCFLFFWQSQIHCWLEILVTQKSYANSSLVLFGGLEIEKGRDWGKRGWKLPFTCLTRPNVRTLHYVLGE